MGAFRGFVITLLAFLVGAVALAAVTPNQDDAAESVEPPAGVGQAGAGGSETVAGGNETAGAAEEASPAAGSNDAGADGAGAST